MARYFALPFLLQSITNNRYYFKIILTQQL